MRRPVFGQREAKKLAHAHQVLREHAEYVNGAKERKPVRKKARKTVSQPEQHMTLLDRVLTSLTLVALAFAAVNIFLPDTAVAAALRVGEIAGISVPV